MADLFDQDMAPPWGLDPDDVALLESLYGELELQPGLYAYDLYIEQGQWTRSAPDLSLATRRRLYRELTEAEARIRAVIEGPKTPLERQFDSVREALRVIHRAEAQIRREEQQ